MKTEPVIGLDFGTTNSALSRTFGADKLKSGEELTTVAKGLALPALEQG